MKNRRNLWIIYFFRDPYLSCPKVLYVLFNKKQDQLT